MGLSPKSNYEKKIVSCFDIGEVPKRPGNWNRNWLYFLPFIFTFEQGGYGSLWTVIQNYVPNYFQHEVVDSFSLNAIKVEDWTESFESPKFSSKSDLKKEIWQKFLSRQKNLDGGNH